MMKKTLRQKVWLWVVNSLAIVGALTLIGFSGGLIYGQLIYKEQFFKSEEPTTVSPSNTAFGFSIPNDYVTAELTPVEPLARVKVSILKISLINPVNKFLSTRLESRDVMEKTFDEIEDYYTEWNYFECDKVVKLEPVAEQRVTGGRVLSCARELRPIEARASQREKAYNIFYLTETENGNFIAQAVVPANSSKEARFRADRIFKTLTWAR